MNKKILIFACLILFLFSIAAVSATDDSNQTVIESSDDLIYCGDTLTDEEIVGINDNGTFTDLKNKIDGADEASIITLENDYAYDSGFGADGIIINKSLTINGNGHIIDASGKSRIFDIVSSSITINNLIFKNGAKSSYGAAIHIDGGSICLSNCSFVNNAAEDAGGAISSYGASISLSDCSFSDNYAGFGGAIYCGDGVIENCSFHDNGAIYRGGAIYGYNLNISNCTFEYNYAENDAHGGAIAGNGYVDSCIFFANDANKGSAISFTDDDSDNWIDVKNSIFLSNPNSDISVYNNQINLSWFGNIVENYARAPDVDVENKLTNWLFLNATVTPSERDYRKSIVVLNYYLYDSISKTVKKIDDLSLPDVYFELSPTNGILDKNVTLPGEKVIFTSTVKTDAVITVKSNYLLSFFISVPFVSPNVLEVPDITMDYGGPEKLEITLTEKDIPIADAQVDIQLDGKDYNVTTNPRGKASLDLNLNSGSYEAVIRYENVSTVANVTVNPVSTKTSLTYDKTSHNAVTLTASVSPATASGNVVFNVNGNNTTVTIKDSKATLNITDLDVGSYTVNATYQGDDNHKSSSSSNVNFTIEEYSFVVSAPNVVKYFGGSERFVVTVSDKARNPVVGEPVKVTINGQAYDRVTGAEGKTTFAISLNSGKYNVTTEHDGEVIKSTITVMSTVKGNNVTKIFRNATSYEATFYDTNGKKVAAGEKVEININGVFYKRTVKDDGSISFALNLEQGTYILTLTNPVTGEKIASAVNILPNIVENNNLTKYYRNASQFTFKLLDDKGNPAVGEKATININGVFYTRTTNDKGVATFNINLEPGTYILTVEYKGCRVANTVKVLSIIKTSDLKMKYRDGSRFKITILDGQGKPYAGQEVTLNINGILYPRVTNSTGTASLAINLMAGEYIITSSYNGLNAANRVTISS